MGAPVEPFTTCRHFQRAVRLGCGELSLERSGKGSQCDLTPALPHTRITDSLTHFSTPPSTHSFSEAVLGLHSHPLTQ